MRQSANLVRKHIVVTGLVQGVGFRYFTVTQARRLGVQGWVRNCRDGSVELEAISHWPAMVRSESRRRA